MSQFLRPDSTITSFQIGAGDHTSIDEAVPNDVDFVRTVSLRDNDDPAVFECGLSNPEGPPQAGVSTFRWRGYEDRDGSYCRASIYQGAVLIDEMVQDMPSVGILDFSFNPDMSAVTDWNDLRARFTIWVPNKAGERQARIYWAELEVPDAIAAGAIIMF